MVNREIVGRLNRNGIEKMKKFIFLILIFSCSIAFADDNDLRKKISQMLIVGFDGTEITQKNPAPSEQDFLFRK